MKKYIPIEEIPFYGNLLNKLVEFDAKKTEIDDLASDLLDERACVLEYETSIHYEWCKALLSLETTAKYNKDVLHLFRESECELLIALIKHNWLISEIFGCDDSIEKSLITVLAYGDRVLIVHDEFIKIENTARGKFCFYKHDSIME
jgi:hypothetical protein